MCVLNKIQPSCHIYCITGIIENNREGLIVYGLNKFCSVLSYTKSFLTCLLMLIYIYVSIIRSSRPSYPKPTSFQICFLFMCEGKIRMIVPRNCCWKGKHSFKKYILFLDVVNHMWKCNIVKTKCLEIFDCILYCRLKLTTEQHLTSQDMF